MTQTQQPRRPGATQKPQDEHNDWSFGPVGAAIATFVWAIFVVLLFRATGVPGWIALFVHTSIGAVLAVAGRHRRPRALSTRSIMYRFVAMFSVGFWIFWNVADTHVGDAAAIVAMFSQVGLLAALPAVAYIGSRIGGWKVAAGATVAALAIGEGLIHALTGSFGVGGLTWIGQVVTVAEPMRGWRDLAGWLWPYTLLLWAAACAGAAILGAVFANHEEDEDKAAERAAKGRFMSRRALAMQRLANELLRTSADRPVLVVNSPEWANGGGESYEFDLSRAGLTWKDLAPICDTIASRLNLDDGCGVEPGKAKGRGRGMLHVSRVNKLADTHLYPLHELKVRSIYSALPMGVLRPGDEVTVMLRQNDLLVVGQKASGKTSTLQALMTGLAQCEDCIIWVIDTGGGGVALPFIYPFLEGRAPRCVIDWIATDDAEALRMATVAMAIGKDRKTYYKGRKKGREDTLLPLDKHVPKVMIVLDEGAQLLGQTATPVGKQACSVLEDVQNTCRDSGIGVVVSSLRAIQTHLPPGLKSGCAARIGMRVTEQTDLAYLFDDYKLNPDEIPEQGSGFILTGHGGEKARVFKSYFQGGDAMDQVAMETWKWRPYLDARGRSIGGIIYRERWKRNAHVLVDEENGGVIHVDLDADPDAGAPPMSPADMHAASPPGGGGTATATLTRPAATGQDPDDEAELRAQLAADTGVDPLDEADRLMRDMKKLKPKAEQVNLADQASVDDAFAALGESFNAGEVAHNPKDPGALPPASPPAGGTPPGPDPTPPVDVPETGGPVPPPLPPGHPRSAAEHAELTEVEAGGDELGEPTTLEPAGAAATIEQLLLNAKGPLRFGEIVKATGVSGTWVKKLLDRATYLKDRASGEKYDHRDRQE